MVKTKMRLVFYNLIAAGVLFLFLPFPADSKPDNSTIFKDTELMFLGEDLYTVSIASRKQEPIQRAPAAVVIINEEDLKKYRTLAEALRSVPGFFVDRNELKERIYLRGIPDSFLIMMDGVPFSSDASTIDYPRGADLSIDILEKIEIIRGPGSALWGADAFSGIINLVTKKGKNLKGIKVKVETGSYDTRGTTIQAGTEKAGWDMFVSGTFSKTEDFERDLPTREKRDDDYNRELYGKLSYKDKFEISGRLSSYRDYYTIRDHLRECSEQKSFSFVQAGYNDSFKKTDVSARLWYQYFDSLDNYDPSRYEQKNRQYGGDVKFDRVFFGNNFATVGSSFRYNDGTAIKLTNGDVKDDYFPSYTTDVFSFYFQNKWKISKNLETTFGIRYDNHSEYEDFTSPRLGVNYIFWEYFNLKFLYGRAFRTPSLVVVMEKPSGLDPEQIDSYEAALGFNYKNIFSAEINYFYNELDDIIERDAEGEIANKSNNHIKGVEVSFSFQPHRSFRLYANYSHLLGDRQSGSSATLSTPSEDDPNETIESTLESFLNVAPDNTVNFGIDLSFLKYCRANLEANYVDDRKLARGGAMLASNRTQLSSYLVFDANLFVENFPLDNLELALRIRNLTDKNYYTRGVFGVMDGKGSSVYFSLSYKF